MANSPCINGQCGVRVYYAGQIGNQLFHYCLGKILAIKYDLAFDPPPAFLDSAGDPVTWSGDPLFVMRPTAGRRYPAEQAFNFGAYHWYDFETLPRDRPLHICYGHWCRYEIYQAWQQQIRQDWLKIPESRFVATDPDAVYIHVRRTDFVQGFNGQPFFNAQYQSVCTPLAGFAAGLSCFPDAKRLVIVTDAPDDPFHAGFAALGLPVTICQGHWDEDFLLLASCRQLMMSMSTFSWWAGWLGRAERIVCPVIAGTYWDHWDDPAASRDTMNLFVSDEPSRWTFMRVSS